MCTKDNRTTAKSGGGLTMMAMAPLILAGVTFYVSDGGPGEWTVAILLAVSLLLLLLRTYMSIRPLHVSVPGPKRYPFLGILPYVVERWHDWPAESWRLSEKYNCTWGGPVPNVGGSPGAWFLLVDPKNVKYILSDNFDNYEKGPTFRSLYGDLLGKGIFSTDAASWVVHRKITSNMFSRNLLRNTAAVTLSKLEQITAKFHDALKTTESGTAQVDIQDVFFRMTFDTISFVAFGCEFDSVREKRQHPFALAFDEMQLKIMERILDPLFSLKRFFRIGARERKIRQLKQALDGYATEIINGRRSSMDEGCELGPDILSRFLDHAKKTNEPLQNRELRDVVMNILIAGRDTTACALSWTFYELTKHPRVVENILEEVNEICGVGADADYTYDTICKLKYTHAVVMEVLRLHPSVTNDHKYAIKDDTLPDGTFIPAGAGVAYMPFAMGRSERIWGKDALEFKPERFLNSKEPSAYKFPAFNAGPRICLGRPLALMTMKLALSFLLPKFEFVDSLGHPGDYRWTLVRAMKGGFVVDVSKRE